MSWRIGISAAWATIYLLFAFSARRRDVERRITLALLVYAILSAIWELVEVVDLLGWMNSLGDTTRQAIRPTGVLILALTFLIASWFFLQISTRRSIGFSIGVICGIFTIMMLLNPFKLMDTVQNGLIYSSLFIGWFSVIGDTFFKTYKTYLKIHNPQHRNRIIYWGFSLGVIAVGDFLVLIGSDLAGSTLHLIGTLLAGYVLLIHDVVDLIRGIVRLFIFGLTSLIGVILYTFVLRLDVSRVDLPIIQSQQNVWIGKAIILLILVQPALTFLYSQMDRLIFGKGFDQSEVVREYGLGVSNLADIHRLAEEAIRFIDHTFGIKSGYLFLVDHLCEENCYCLRPVLPDDSPVHRGLKTGRIAAESPFSRYFTGTQRPLTQYDIDFSPRFRYIGSEERQWIADLQADLFVPICTKDAWIGLFVLGPKNSGNRYFDEDIDMLTTLADQTVAALQNTRLVTDLQAASKALEEANQRLRELDEMKSAFIGVITHEMRTPLANISFAMQILEKYGTNNLTAEQLKQLVQVSKGVKATRTLIDNLILHASFLNNQVVLKAEKIDFRDFLTQIVDSFMKTVTEKDLRLKVDSAEQPLQVIGDRKLLQVAVNHLIDNAVKFTNPGGKIWITTWKTSNALRFDIRDTGKGIAQEKIDTLWQSFTQPGSDPLKRGLEGLGLGLSLVKFIITAHGGFVGVESEEGVGSIFNFRIPLQGPSAPLSPESDALSGNPFIEQEILS